PLVVLLVVHLGARHLGCSRAALRAWREVAVVMGIVLAGAVLVYSLDVGGPGQATGLVVAAAGEELVYRLAVIVLVGALAARVAGRDWRHPDRWGTGPGVQIGGLASAVPFASLAVLLGWVVLRTGMIWPAIAAHALLNLTTITVSATD